MSYSLTQKSNYNRLVKCSINHAYKFLWFIILDLCVNVHSCFAIFVSGQILNRLGIDSGIQKIGDIGVAQLMGRYIKIQTVNKFGIVLLVTSQSRVYQFIIYLIR